MQTHPSTRISNMRLISASDEASTRLLTPHTIEIDGDTFAVPDYLAKNPHPWISKGQVALGLIVALVGGYAVLLFAHPVSAARPSLAQPQMAPRGILRTPGAEIMSPSHPAPRSGLVAVPPYVHHTQPERLVARPASLAEVTGFFSWLWGYLQTPVLIWCAFSCVCPE